MQNKKKIFISDLHLEEKRPEITQQFLHFLKHCDRSSLDAIYILGDLFESWIGDDDPRLFLQEIILALKSVTILGIPIYFMHGNRDFLVGQKFLNATGCQFLADETVVTIYNTPVLVMHGDTLCQQDTAYLRTRKIMRNFMLQKLFLLLPLTLRKKIVNKIRNSSHQHTRTIPATMMDVTHDAVIKTMQKHSVNFLIHGHTHRPYIHNVFLENKDAYRVVLGAWEQHAEIFIWEQNGKQTLKKLTDYCD